MKLQIQGVWQNAHKFIRKLAHCCALTMTFYHTQGGPHSWKS